MAATHGSIAARRSQCDTTKALPLRPLPHAAAAHGALAAEIRASHTPPHQSDRRALPHSYSADALLLYQPNPSPLIASHQLLAVAPRMRPRSEPEAAAARRHRCSGRRGLPRPEASQARPTRAPRALPPRVPPPSRHRHHHDHQGELCARTEACVMRPSQNPSVIAQPDSDGPHVCLL